MIDQQTAEKIAHEQLNEMISLEGSDEIVIASELTREKEYGWIVFWDSKMRLETGNDKYSLIGGGPVVIEKSDGSLHFLGSRLGVDDGIKEYEKKRPK